MHHHQSIFDAPDLRLCTFNLVSLCRRCHGKLHATTPAREWDSHALPAAQQPESQPAKLWFTPRDLKHADRLCRLLIKQSRINYINRKYRKSFHGSRITRPILRDTFCIMLKNSLTVAKPREGRAGSRMGECGVAAIAAYLRSREHGEIHHNAIAWMKRLVVEAGLIISIADAEPGRKCECWSPVGLAWEMPFLGDVKPETLLPEQVKSLAARRRLTDATEAALSSYQSRSAPVSCIWSMPSGQDHPNTSIMTAQPQSVTSLPDLTCHTKEFFDHSTLYHGVTAPTPEGEAVKAIDAMVADWAFGLSAPAPAPSDACVDGWLEYPA